MTAAWDVTFGHDSWPTPEQKLLLRACLLPDAAAVTAWEEWRRRVDFESLNLANQRMIPLLHQNLRRLGVADPVMGRYHGIHRRAWYRTQHLLHRATGMAARLQAAGIPTLWLKGAALACAYYEDVGLRPMSDCDILVPPERAGEAIRIMRADGWKPNPARTPQELETHVVAKRRGWNFVGPDDFAVDLHWRILGTSAPADAALEQSFWAAARPLRIQRLDALTLDATDHLLHTCVHGIAWNRYPSMRWVADAMTILTRAGPAVDWDRVTGQVRQRRLAVIMAHTLTYLQREFSAPVPAAAIAAIRGLPVSSWEFAEFRAMTGAEFDQKRRYHLWHRFRRFRSTSSEWGRGSAFSAYLRYLQMHWELDHAGQIPVRLLKKAGAGLWRLRDR